MHAKREVSDLRSRTGALGTARAAALLGALSVGCAHLGARETAAVLLAPSEAARAELRAVLSEALGSEPALAADALTRSSTLVIERAPQRNVALTGRTLATDVERFDLVTDGRRCVLVRRADESRARLREAACRPE